MSNSKPNLQKFYLEGLRRSVPGCGHLQRNFSTSIHLLSFVNYWRLKRWMLFIKQKMFADWVIKYWFPFISFISILKSLSPLPLYEYKEALTSNICTNQSTVFRSRDLYWPIRAQFYSSRWQPPSSQEELEGGRNLFCHFEREPVLPFLLSRYSQKQRERVSSSLPLFAVYLLNVEYMHYMHCICIISILLWSW